MHCISICQFLYQPKKYLMNTMAMYYTRRMTYSNVSQLLIQSSYQIRALFCSMFNRWVSQPIGLRISLQIIFLSILREKQIIGRGGAGRAQADQVCSAMMKEETEQGQPLNLILLLHH